MPVVIQYKVTTLWIFLLLLLYSLSADCSQGMYISISILSLDFLGNSYPFLILANFG